MTPDGQTCTAIGLTDPLVSGAATEYVGGSFDETFSGTVPSCTGGGGEVPSPEPAVANLRGEVIGIPDVTSSAELVAILDEAAAKLAQPEPADRQADAIDKLDDYVESGRLSPEQGATLMAGAQAIIDHLAAAG